MDFDPVVTDFTAAFMRPPSGLYCGIYVPSLWTLLRHLRALPPPPGLYRGIYAPSLWALLWHLRALPLGFTVAFTCPPPVRGTVFTVYGWGSEEQEPALGR